jgi:protease I
MKRAAIIIADGYTDCEFCVAYHCLKAADFDVVVFSINGGEVRGINGWLHKTIDRFGQITHTIASRLTFEVWNEWQADVLVLIGGVRALEYLRQSIPLVDWIREHFSSNKLIASVCHGAQLLIQADIIRGRIITGYYSIQRDIENAGATYVRETVVWDYPFVTSPHYDFSGLWMRDVIKIFNKRNSK